MALEDKVLKMICSRKKGMLQNEIWKKLEIDSRKCSRILANLEKKGLITRQWEVANGVRTYRVLSAKSKFEVLMAGDMIAPCCGCTRECVPEYCVPLTRWIQALL